MPSVGCEGEDGKSAFGILLGETLRRDAEMRDEKSSNVESFLVIFEAIINAISI